MNLHVHSSFSCRDAISSVREIAERQKELGYDYFTITDHGTLAAFPEAFLVAEELGMNFMPGLEVYLVPPKEIDERERVLEVTTARKLLSKKTAKEEEIAQAQATLAYWEKPTKRYFHLTLLATSQVGLENLFRIYSAGETYYKYRHSIDIIEKYKEGITVLSGCFGSELCWYVRTRDYDRAKKLIQDYKNMFENYYIELQYHNLKTEPGELNEYDMYKKIIELAGDVPMVFTNDSHYTRKEDSKMHKIFRSMCSNEIDGEEYHLLSKEEMLAKLSMFGVSAENINIIPENIFMPKNKISKANDEELLSLVEDGFKKKRLNTPYETQSRDRYKFELEIIKEKGFSNYFITKQRILKKARELDIMQGPARGSAAGSEVCFLLGITKVDPLKHGLMFERFMNPGRANLPDIDTDLSTKADTGLAVNLLLESLDYPFKASISNVTHGTPVVLFKKLASYFGVPFSEANKLTTSEQKLILETEASEDDFIQSLSSIGIEYTEEWRQVFENIEILKLSGLPFGTSVHASGKIISEEEINLPVSNGVINFNGAELERYGYLKIDLLSLATLDPIKKFLGIDYDWEDFSDKKAWEVLNNADTDYVFQFQAGIPRKMLSEVKIETIEQLAAISAINRPGPLSMDLHTKWVQAQNGEVTLDKEELIIKKILKESFGEEHSGMMIFQEDVMKLFQMAGFTLQEADDVRRAIGKKDEKLLQSFKQRFIENWKYDII